MPMPYGDSYSAVQSAELAQDAQRRANTAALGNLGLALMDRNRIRQNQDRDFDFRQQAYVDELARDDRNYGLREREFNFRRKQWDDEKAALEKEKGNDLQQADIIGNILSKTLFDADTALEKQVADLKGMDTDIAAVNNSVQRGLSRGLLAFDKNRGFQAVSPEYAPMAQAGNALMAKQAKREQLAAQVEELKARRDMTLRDAAKSGFMYDEGNREFVHPGLNKRYRYQMPQPAPSMKGVKPMMDPQVGALNRGIAAYRKDVANSGGRGRIVVPQLPPQQSHVITSGWTPSRGGPGPVVEQRVTVRLPDGRVGTVDSNQLERALSMGAQVVNN